MKILVNIDVPELAPAIKFYSAALGLTFNRQIDNNVAELVGASAVIYLLQKKPGSRCASTFSAVRDYRRHWSPLHIDFVVENLSEARTQAIDAGALQESECVEWNGSRCISFSDPFGHGFCLIEFDGEGYAFNGNVPF